MTDFDFLPTHRPRRPCPHGNRGDCECQLDVYDGLFVWWLLKENGNRQYLVSYMQKAHDGGMVAFLNPITGENDGCAGINWAREEVMTLDEFNDKHKEAKI